MHRKNLWFKEDGAVGTLSEDAVIAFYVEKHVLRLRGLIRAEAA
jgi:hypothetical protein